MRSYQLSAETGQLQSGHASLLKPPALAGGVVTSIEARTPRDGVFHLACGKDPAARSQRIVPAAIERIATPLTTPAPPRQAKEPPVRQPWHGRRLAHRICPLLQPAKSAVRDRADPDFSLPSDSRYASSLQGAANQYGPASSQAEKHTSNTSRRHRKSFVPASRPLYRNTCHVIADQHAKDARAIPACRAPLAATGIRVAARIVRLFVRTAADFLRGHARHERRRQSHDPGLCGDSSAGSVAVVHPAQRDSARRKRLPGPVAKHLQRDRARHVRLPHDIAGDTVPISVVHARAGGATVGNGDAGSLAKRIRRAAGPRTSRPGILVRLQRYAGPGGSRRAGGAGSS